MMRDKDGRIIIKLKKDKKIKNKKLTNERINNGDRRAIRVMFSEGLSNSEIKEARPELFGDINIDRKLNTMRSRWEWHLKNDQL